MPESRVDGSAPWEWFAPRVPRRLWPGPWHLQPHLCTGVIVTCPSSRLGSLGPFVYGLVDKSNAWEGFLCFRGGFHPSKKTIHVEDPAAVKISPYDCDVVSKQMISTVGEGQTRFLQAMFMPYFSSLFNVVDCSVF